MFSTSPTILSPGAYTYTSVTCADVLTTSNVCCPEGSCPLPTTQVVSPAATVTELVPDASLALCSAEQPAISDVDATVTMRTARARTCGSMAMAPSRLERPGQAARRLRVCGSWPGCPHSVGRGPDARGRRGRTPPLRESGSTPRRWPAPSWSAG